MLLHFTIGKEEDFQNNDNIETKFIVDLCLCELQE